MVVYAQHHAGERFAQGFTLNQLMAEYRALRASVMHRWASHRDAARHGQDIGDLVQFNEAVDEALFESAVWYGERLANARDLFVGALGHDLRNPLGAIAMSAQLLLRDENLGLESTKAAVRVHNSAARMRKMIDDLLDFTRVRLGHRLPIDATRGSLGPVFSQTVDELIAYHPTATVEYSCEGNLEGDWDIGRLGQALSNLVGNAIQHGEPRTPVTVLARGETDAVVVTVHNHGPAIAPELRDRLFDPLTRGVVREAERRIRQEGLGLGLFIADHIVRAHGGRIDIESTDKAGTTFRVTLPRHAPPGAFA